MRFATRAARAFAALPLAIAAAACMATGVAPDAVTAQSTLERSPLAGHDWIGFPWAAEVSILAAFDDPAGPGLDADPAFHAALGLPRDAVVGARFTPEPSASADVTGPTTVDGFVRYRPWAQDAGGLVDLTGEFMVARDGDQWRSGAAVHAARWLGGLRLMAHGGVDPSDASDIAVGGGAIWHVLPGVVPIALAGDVTARPWAEGDPDPAWSAGVQVGLSFTTHTLSLFATNAGLTVSGRQVGTDRVRAGIELTAPVPLGRFFGAYVARSTATDAVAPVEAPARPAAVTVPIREYRYAPQRLVIEAGTVVEWVNEDEVMHTASADDGAWGSGAIPPGERWRARFDEPGIYPYHCGPHPFMRGVVIVR